MTIGTKSVLYGAHCFFLHPFFVAWGWWRLYGFPWDPRLWYAFFLHDIGYVGKPNMDGPEGEMHPYIGARVMGLLFGPEWYLFTLLHSRYLAKSLGKQPSRLCMADKLAFALTPAWLYLPMVRATGEIKEYMAQAQARAQIGIKGHITDEEMRGLASQSEYEWHAGVKSYMERWVAEHVDGKADTWTNSRQGQFK